MSLRDQNRKNEMEEIKKLYPMSFLPIAETYEWGGDELGRRFDKAFIQCDENGRERKLEKDGPVAESLELADLGYRDSQVASGWLAGNTIGDIMDMYLDRVVGEDVFQSYGRQFPVSVKFIDACGQMPLIVHPDDETSGPRYDFLGKAKLWYIIDAKPESSIVVGFREDADVQSFIEACDDGTVIGQLNVVHPKAGDVFMIEPGTVHSASGGVLIFEVSESSPLDFCLSNWGKDFPGRQFDPNLGLVEALDFIDFKAYKPYDIPSGSGNIHKLVSRKEFSLSKLDLVDPLHILAENSGSFSLYSCIGGEASVQTENDSFILKAGTTVLVPAEIEDFFLVPRQSGTVLMEVSMEHSSDEDEYIDPSAAPSLPDEEPQNHNMSWRIL